MKSNLVLVVTTLTLAVSCLTTSHSTPTVGLARREGSACWEALCFLDGYTLHWRQTASKYADAETAAREHAKKHGARHNTLVDRCD